MKSFKLDEVGGFPRTQEVTKYTQDAYTEAILAILASAGDLAGPMVVSGMVISNSGNTVSSGWFVYNSELIKFTGGTVIPGGGQVALVSITNNAYGLTYADTTIHNVKLESTATIIAAASVTDATHFPVSALKPFAMPFISTGIVLATPPSGSIWTSGTSLFYSVTYKVQANEVALSGYLNSAGLGTGGGVPVLTLPAIARPAKNVCVGVRATFGSSIVAAIATIGTDGVLRLENGLYTGACDLYLDGVNYRLV